MLSERERHLMEHATGWRSEHPLYRNRFCVGPEGDDFPAWQELVVRGLAERNGPTEWVGGMFTFVVTDAGLRALKERP